MQFLRHDLSLFLRYDKMSSCFVFILLFLFPVFCCIKGHFQTVIDFFFRLQTLILGEVKQALQLQKAISICYNKGVQSLARGLFAVRDEALYGSRLVHTFFPTKGDCTDSK